MDYDQVSESLFCRTNNTFKPFSLLANELSNDILHCAQAMKACDTEDFKKTMAKEVNDLHEEDVFDAKYL